MAAGGLVPEIGLLYAQRLPESRRIPDLPRSKLIEKLVTRQWLILWAVASLVAVYYALLPQQASLLDGVYHFSSYDSFYHARIIGDTLIAFPDIVEFDARLHPLEKGAWISVAWGFDYLMALIVILLRAIFSDLPVSSILAHIAALWAALNCLLLIAICRSLGLGIFASSLAVAAFALSPITQQTHLVGNIDHHFIESSFILLILYSSLNWINHANSARAAIFAGMALGFAHAFHIALFVMYLPLGIFLLLAWIRSDHGRFAQAHLLAASTLGATALAVIPSSHLYRLEFVYNYTGWFHVYWSAAFCLCILFMMRFRYRPRNLAILFSMAALMIFPLLGNLQHGASFVASTMPGFGQIEETDSLFTFLFIGQWNYYAQLYGLYSGLFFLLPFSLILFASIAIRQKRADHLYFLIAVVIGTIFLFAQLRFKYHAAYILAIPLLVVFQQWRPPQKEVKTLLGLLVFLACYIGPIKQLYEPRILGGQPGYRVLFPFYMAIAKQCENNPGVLLAHPDEGHYLRYYSDCTLVASNLLATPRDFEYKRMAEEMFALPLPELVTQYDWIDYIYVRREDGMQPGLSEQQLRSLNRGIRGDILLQANPPGVQLLLEMPTPNEPFVRLVKPIK